MQQRLPDSFDNSRDNNHGTATSEDEDPTLGLGLFMSCDIGMPSFFSNRNSNNPLSNISSKLKPSLYSQAKGLSQMAHGLNSKISSLSQLS